ncbi:outer membrane protein assembly factor BamB family protein [Luteolibacter soli]|uniref:PQQ-binding-like beta-propeller repeat protein n=1 Tax=Luteolibacter soli TaxID=3135280 RepID=A0ABU9B265_9BACT
MPFGGAAALRATYELWPKLESPPLGVSTSLQAMEDRVYLGICRHVLCVHKRTGREIWRAELKRTQLVTVMVADDIILAHAGGSLFGLRMEDGAILWRNDLPGLGYGYCTLATDGSASSGAAAASQQAQQAQVAAMAAATAASTAAASS